MPVSIFAVIEIFYLGQGKSLLIDFDLLGTKAFNESWSDSEFEKQFELIWGTKFDLYFNTIYGLSLIPFIIPSFSVSVRRLHDFGKPVFYLIFYIAVLGSIEGYNFAYPNTNGVFVYIFFVIIFYIYMSQKSNSKKNKFGVAPKKIK